MRSWLPIFTLGFIVSLGTFWSFGRGGQDFAVFYKAWSLVHSGKGLEIYTNSPDRFLYAPGFAWIFSPLAWLPQKAALAVWNLSKAGAVAWLVVRLGEQQEKQVLYSQYSFSRQEARGLAALAFVLLARPLLIDFQYGQVNTFVLAACVWGLLSLFSEVPSRVQVSLSWFFLGIIAVSKLFALPLLLVPWFLRLNRTAGWAGWSSIFGVLTAAVIPALFLGYSNSIHLYEAWQAALVAKGLPFESHNQSLIAFLGHYFTVNPTHVIALGWKWVVLGWNLLSLEQITELSLGWSLVWVGFLLVWIIRGDRKDVLKWVGVTIGLLFLPSHLIWKPYFVLSYPLAVVLLSRFTRSKLWLLILGFAVMNLTGFDLIGGFFAARVEAASAFLWVHLGYLACVIWGVPDSEPRKLITD